MSLQAPSNVTELVVDTFDSDVRYTFDEVETITIPTLQEEANVLQEYVNQAAFGKPIEPVLAALPPNLGRYMAKLSYGARYQTSLYVKRAFDQAATTGANVAAHVCCRENYIIELPFWDRPRMGGIGELYFSDRYRPVCILNHAGSDHPAWSLCVKTMKRASASSSKCLACPQFSMQETFSMNASSNYYTATL